MGTETYRVRFDEYLESASVIEDSFSRIMALVLMRLGLASGDRKEEFEHWASRMQFDCGRCGRIFAVEGRAIDEEEAVLCPACERAR